MQSGKTIHIFLINFLIAFPVTTISAQISRGNSTQIKAIEKEARFLYDHNNKQRWFLTNKKITEEASSAGTEITVYSFNDSITGSHVLATIAKVNGAKNFI